METLLWVVLVTWLFMSLAFVLAHKLNRTDVVDGAWGLGFVVVVWTAWLVNGHHFGIKLLSAEFVSLWGLRLFFHLLLRGKDKPEDYRYQVYRERWGRRFWPRAYSNIFLLQGVLIVAISITTMAIMTTTSTPLLWLTTLGFAVWIFGIVFEAEADAELTKFVRTKKPGEIMQEGLWRYSRHPNYFGEVTTWWGAALVAVSLQQWWGVVGALIITVLITKVSGIPPLEKHYADNAVFQKYKRRTSVLIPLPPKR